MVAIVTPMGHTMELTDITSSNVFSCFPNILTCETAFWVNSRENHSYGLETWKVRTLSVSRWPGSISHNSVIYKYLHFNRLDICNKRHSTIIAFISLCTCVTSESIYYLFVCCSSLSLRGRSHNSSCGIYLYMIWTNEWVMWFVRPA